MSAANATATAPSADAEQRAHEPSMEEILASIRRIIADDDAFPAARRRSKELEERAPDAAAAPAPAQDGEPSAALSAYPEPALERRAPPPVEPAGADGDDDGARDARSAYPPAADIRPLRLNLPESDAETSGAESENADHDGYGDAPRGAELDAYGRPSDAGGHGFAGEFDAPLVSSDAASSIAAQFETLAASMILNDSGLLQKYAQEMMRPMLKQWLDDNLPVIVERLVRAEIERVARGRRR